MRRVLLLGATGLVGGELLKLLLADESIASVRVVARNSTGEHHAKLQQLILSDLTEIERKEHQSAFAVDQIVCAPWEQRSKKRDRRKSSELSITTCP